MSCPVCGANPEQIMSTTDGVSIVCPMCGEYDVASSVLATEQLQRLEPEERGKQGEAFGPAGRSPHDHNQLDRSGHRTRRAIGGRCRISVS